MTTLKEEMRNILGIKDNKMLEISLDRLREPAKVETSVLTRDRQSNGRDPMIKTGEFKTDSHTLAIDFSYLTNNSSFQRAIMEFIKKYIPGFENIKARGNKEVMKQSFNENMNNYRNVMNEFKTKLEGVKKRNES